MRSLKTGQGSVASCRRVGRLAAACLAAAVLAAAATAAGQEQKTLRQHPGYFPVEDLDLLEREALSIEINLHGAMLRLVAAATRKAEPEFSNLIADPEAVRVRIAPLAKLDLD